MNNFQNIKRMVRECLRSQKKKIIFNKSAAWGVEDFKRGVEDFGNTTPQETFFKKRKVCSQKNVSRISLRPSGGLESSPIRK